MADEDELPDRPHFAAKLQEYFKFISKITKKFDC